MNENIFVGGLDTIPYEISTKVEDFNGNITSIESKVITPQFLKKL